MDELKHLEERIAQVAHHNANRYNRLEKQIQKTRREVNTMFGMLCVAVGYEVVWMIGWALGAW